MTPDDQIKAALAPLTQLATQLVNTLAALPDVLTAATRDTIAVPPTADLLAFLGSTNLAGKTVLVPRGAEYRLTASCVVTAPNVSFAAFGVGPAPRVVGAGGAGGLFVVQGPNASFDGIETDCLPGVDRNAFTFWGAGVTVRNHSFRSTGGEAGVKCTPGCSQVTVRDSAFNPGIGAACVWVDGQVVNLLNCTIDYTGGEQAVRANSTALTDFTMDGCRVTYRGSNRKECLSCRMGKRFRITNNTFVGLGFPQDPSGAVVFGDNPYPPGGACTDARFQRNTLLNGSVMYVRPGVTLLDVSDNDFHADTVIVPVHIQGPGVQGAVANNRRWVHNGPTGKPPAVVDGGNAPGLLTSSGWTDRVAPA